MLSSGEFAVAMHLIQKRLCGYGIPSTLPSTLKPELRPLVYIPPFKEDEERAYGKIFDWINPSEDHHLHSKWYTHIFYKKLLYKKLLLNFLPNYNRNTLGYYSHNSRKQKIN